MSTAPIVWSAVCSDAAGTNLYACINSTTTTTGYKYGIYRSNDSGLNWSQTSTSAAIAGNFTAICCSDNGKYVYACIKTMDTTKKNGIYYSSDNGQTFKRYTYDSTILNGGALDYTSICCDKDGKRVYACVNNYMPYIYTNNNYGGGSWTQLKDLNGFSPSGFWSGICCSASGIKMFCCQKIESQNAANNKNIVYYDDEGVSFNNAYINTTSTYPMKLQTICCSADGSKIFAAVNNESKYNINGFWYSQDYGASFSQTNNAVYTTNFICCDSLAKNILMTSKKMYFSINNCTTIATSLEQNKLWSGCWCDKNTGTQLVGVNSDGEIWINNKASSNVWKMVVNPSTTFTSGSLISNFSFLGQQVESDTLIPGTLDPTMVSSGKLADIIIPLLFIKLKKYAFEKSTMVKNVEKNLGKFLFMNALQNSTNNKVSDLVQQYFPDQAESILPQLQSVLSMFFSENIKSIQESSADLDVSELSSENAVVLTTIQQAIQSSIQDSDTLGLLN
jgi:hypothetical protein